MAKYSIVFGNNYPGTTNALNGCVADGHFYEKVFAKLKFDEVSSFYNESCTRDSMYENIKSTLQKAKITDLVAITYSGHGAIVPPAIQSWIPFDFDWNNSATWLTYNDLDNLFLKHEAAGVKVVVISDSCHSQANPLLHFRNLAPETQVKGRFIQAPPEIARRILSDPFHKNALTNDQDDILLSGCSRQDTSADAFINGAYHGAFSYSLEVALQAFLNGETDVMPSYQQLILKSRAWLAGNGYHQVPSADGDPALLNLPFLS